MRQYVQLMQIVALHLASGQIQMRKVDGWETLSQPLAPMPLDLAA